MNDLPRQKLQEIVASYDKEVYLDPQRCRSILLDLCGEYRREINILITILEEQIVADLLNHSESVPYDILFARLAKRLYENWGLPEELARWGIESWALALGKMPPPTSGIPDVNEEKFASEWRIIGKTVRGACHTTSDMPNQDAILWKQNSEMGVPLVLVIADGHSSEKSFRGDIGAQFAVEVSNEVLYHFANEFSNRSLSAIEEATKRLPLEIVSKWRVLVEKHWQQHIPSDGEWAWLKSNADTWEVIAANPSICYGATLLGVLLAEFFILYFQLGSGDILAVSASSEVSEPMPYRHDPTILTPSLADSMPEQYFRVHFQGFEGIKPALIMLSTDGYSNSFSERSGFYKVGSDIWNILYSNGKAGLKTIEESLERWFTRTSEAGSGDDITVGLLCRMGALMSEATQETLSISSTPNLESHLRSGRASNTLEARAGQDSPITRPIPARNEETNPPSLQPPPTEAPKAQELPKGKRQQKQELFVSQDGRGDYTTISDAISKAARRSHTRILVQSGIYTERLVINKPVSIIGNGPQVIVENSNSSCIQMQAELATVSGLILHGKGEGSPTVEIRAGQLVLQECDITSDLSHCVVIRTQRATPLIEKCTIHDANGSGIVIHNGAHGTIVDCNIFDNATSGILIHDHGKGEIKGCNISRNASAGVEVKEHAKLTAEECRIHHGKGCGVLVYERGEAEMARCHIFSNTSAGVEIKEHGALTISGCEIYEGKRNGILIHKNGAGEVKSCTIYGNALAGVKLQEGDRSVVVQDCRIKDGKGCGILIYREAQDEDEVEQDEESLQKVEVIKCDIRGNAQAGIEITNYSNPMIRECTVSQGERSGILVCNHSKGTIEDCHISENSYFGIAVKENSHLTVKSSTICYNAYQAVLVSGNSSVNIEERCLLTPNTGGKFYKETGCQVQYYPKRGFVQPFSWLFNSASS